MFYTREELHKLNMRNNNIGKPNAYSTRDKIIGVNIIDNELGG
jgi:hypothetical protein